MLHTAAHCTLYTAHCAIIEPAVQPLRFFPGADVLIFKLINKFNVYGLHNLILSNRMSIRGGKVLILGGSGTFGRLVARLLCRESRRRLRKQGGEERIELILSGRSAEKLDRARSELEEKEKGDIWTHAAPLSSFCETLSIVRPSVVVHAAGGYERGRGFDVATECLKHNVHYLDLADDRDYIKQFKTKFGHCGEESPALITGASTTPGVTSVVVSHIVETWKTMGVDPKSVSIAISPGNRLPRGEETIRSVLSYCGRPFDCFEDGRWIQRYGWQDLTYASMLGLGRRAVSNINVSDHDLFPDAYDLETVAFKAGLELQFFQYGILLLSYIVRWVPFAPSASYFAPLLMKTSLNFNRLGSDDGGMKISVKGHTREGLETSASWSFFAGAGQGPYTPAVASAILARKACEGTLKGGGRVCMNEFSIDEFKNQLDSMNFHFYENMDERDEERDLFGHAFGDIFAPPFFRKFHGKGGVVYGEMNVGVGAGIVAKAMGFFANFPRPIEKVDIRVVSSIESEKGGAIRWERKFAHHGAPLASTVEWRDGVMIENFSIFGGLVPVSFSFRLEPVLKQCECRKNPSVLRGFKHITTRMRLFNIPVPRWCALTADGTSMLVDDGTGDGQGDAWDVDVEVAAPFNIGTVLSYRGRVRKSTAELGVVRG